MRKKIEWNWEELDKNTFRTKAIGGWLVRSEYVCIHDKAKSMHSCVSTVFLEDKDHEWTITAPFNPSDPGKVHTKVKAEDFELPK